MAGRNGPNGFFIDGLIWWGDSLDGECWVTKGFILEPLDLSGASVRQRNSYKTMLMTLLASFGDDFHCQWQWGVGSDFRDALFRYREESTKADDRWTKFARGERFARYWDRMESGRLRRERVALFVSHRVKVNLAGTASVMRRSASTQLDKVLEQERVNFETILDTTRNLLTNTTVRPMEDAEHFQWLRGYVNPSLSFGHPEEVVGELDPELTIQENVFRGGISKCPDCSFFLDGFYHNVVVVTRWPRSSYPGIIKPLLNLPFLSYSVTENIHPRSVRMEMEQEERLIERISGDFQNEKKYSLLSALRKKQAKVDALANGYTLPFQVLMLVRVWDETLEGLAGKTTAVKNAVTNMGGAQSYHVVQFTAAKHLFFQGVPGWIGGKYNYRDIYAEHEYLADLVPFSTTFVGHLDEAEAIYDGDNGQAVGVRLFAKGTPQHGVLFGMTGSGKSAFMADLLSQTQQDYAYTVLVEEGLSYGVWTQTQGCRPIILQPDGDLTINYFDTNGLPLTALQLSGVSALALRMAGVSEDPERNNRRLAYIGEYARQLYDDVAREWLEVNEERAWQVTLTANAIERWRAERMSMGSSYIEAFADFRDLAERNADEAAEWVRSIDEKKVLQWSKTEKGDAAIRQQVFSHLEPDQYPQHSGLVEMMRFGAMSHHPKDEIHTISDLLNPWTASGGMYGSLVDGVTNCDLQGRVAHFELGLIPESASELKAVAGFLITQFSRQHILTLPRGVRKRIIFEEVARFLDVPGGEKIVEESYGQLRKFSTVVFSIIQQYARFRSSRIRPVIMNNSKTLFIMRQTDRSDLEEIANDKGLTPAVVETVLSYPLPEQQSDRDRYSSVMYVAEDGAQKLNGTLRHYCSPEMLYVSSSDGATFDARSKALREYPDVVEGIFAEVDKNKGGEVENTSAPRRGPAGKARQIDLVGITSGT